MAFGGRQGGESELNEELDRAVEMVFPPAKFRIQNSQSATWDSPAPGAAGRTLQVFVNLLTNARRPWIGGGFIETRDRGGFLVVIGIRDTGPGIPRTRFLRYSSLFHHQGRGTGLGLAIVKQHRGCMAGWSGWNRDCLERARFD